MSNFGLPRFKLLKKLVTNKSYPLPKNKLNKLYQNYCDNSKYVPFKHKDIQIGDSKYGGYGLVATDFIKMGNILLIENGWFNLRCLEFVQYV